MAIIRIEHKTYIKGEGGTRSYCRLVLSNGKFITSIGEYADTLNQFRVHTNVWGETDIDDQKKACSDI